ncbi:hypothetical protein HNP33_002205 [Comamonas odontotermitis]|uniref:Uncharacterized protein n=1 Tax=Comamonas odontotermitis TaxID=379895 RepID=A0ABR6RG52_9BURK|nr:hypothetical protein [Comamonas odontotermitis]
MNGVEAAMRGECESCGSKTHHGPWSAEQIAAVIDDLGSSQDEFGDLCDECLVREIGKGDVAYTEHLLRRPMNVLPKTNGLLSLICAYQKGAPNETD